MNLNLRINLNQWRIPQGEQEFKRQPCIYSITETSTPLSSYNAEKRSFKEVSTFFHSTFHVK